jgi:outer membrane protein OmpA-like peptidoglycan-associated protein
VTASILAALVPMARDAHAQDLRYHLEASTAQAAGGPQQSEFGLGAGGEVAVELPLNHMVGGQMEAGGVWLSAGTPSSAPGVEKKSAGEAVGVMAGLRFHAGRAEGLWLDADIGAVQTGPLARPAIDAHVGYDARAGGAGSRWSVGPFIGYEQVFEPANAAFPDDAHILEFGIHFSLGAPSPRVGAPKGMEASAHAPSVSRAAEVAPAPVPIAAPVMLTDVDGDGVLDLRDACPTIPGVATEDPATNGCPPPVNGISVERDLIVLGDRIYFDTDRARIKHVSWDLVRRLAEFIKAHPELEQVSIEGHADEVGDDAHNENLSRARAEAVKAMLVRRFEVDERALVVHAWGESRPADPGHSEQAHEKNRRVELVITRARVPDGSVPAPPASLTSRGEP